MDLAKARSELGELNKQLLHLIRIRSQLVKLILLHKKECGLTTYNVEQEKKVFGQLSQQIKEVDLKELLAFSLILESQASQLAGNDYPQWSSKLPLNGGDQKLSAMVNPTLLKVWSTQLFAQLPIGERFKEGDDKGPIP